VTTARHELPEIDEAALRTARLAERALARVRDAGLSRWEAYLTPLPERLRDAPLPELRATARRVRSAFGPKDSIRDALPEELTEPFLDAIDRLLRELNRSPLRG